MHHFIIEVTTTLCERGWGGQNSMIIIFKQPPHMHVGTNYS